MKLHLCILGLSVLGVDASSKKGNGSSSKGKNVVNSFLKGRKSGEKALFNTPEGFGKRGNLFKKMCKDGEGKKLLERSLKMITKNRNGKAIKFSEASKYLGQLSVDEIIRISEIDDGCYLLGGVLAGLKGSVLKKLEHKDCIVHMVAGAMNEFPKGEMVPSIPSEWLEVSQRIIEHISPALHLATPEFIKKLNEESKAAQYVDATTLNKMKSQQLSKFKPKFFAKIRKVGKKLMRKVFVHLPSDIFSHFKGPISEQAIKGITPAQIGKFGSELEGKGRCKNLPLHAANEAQLKLVKAECILSYLGNKKNKEKSKGGLQKKWTFIDADWAKDLDSEQVEQLKNLTKEDKRNIPAATWNNMLKSLDICENIKGKGIYGSSEPFITASPECFTRIKDSNLQAHILMNPEVSENILTHANSKTFSKLKFTVGKKDYSGFEIFKLMKSSNKSLIIKNMSTKLEDGDHACAAIKDAESFHKISSYFTEASSECFSAIDMQWSREDFNKSPVLLATLNAKDALEMFEGEMEKINAASFTELLKKNILQEMDYESFMKVNPSAMSAVTSPYLSQMNFVEKLTEATIQRFDAHVFETSDATFFNNKIGTAKVSDEQLPHISVKVSKASDRFTVKFDANKVKDLGKRFSLLSSLQLESIPAAAFTALTAAQFTTLKPESLTRVTDEQIQQVPEDVRATLTPQQAAMVGKDVSDSKKSPVKSFQAMKSKLKSETQPIIEKRSTKEANASPMLLTPSLTLASLALIWTLFC